MKRENSKRLVWFAVFMVWIGAVSAILLHEKTSPTTQSPPEQTISTQSAPTANQSQVIITQQSSEEIVSEKTQNIQLGKAKEENKEDDFFVKYRLERDKVRSEQVNHLRELINNPNTDTEKKKEAQDTLLNLTKKIEQEMEIESLIRVQGFPEALAYLHDNSVDVIVQTEGLTRNEATKIGHIVIRITNFREEDINILEKHTSKN